MTTIWTKAAENKLKRLRGEGYSYATIAAMMGTTKNVLLGHVWREKVRNGHRPANSKKLQPNTKRKAWAARRLEAVTLTLVGYSHADVAKKFDACITQISKWRADGETRAKAEQIAAQLPKVGKAARQKPKIKRVISPEVRAQRAEHMRQVSRRYWDEKRVAQ